MKTNKFWKYITHLGSAPLMLLPIIMVFAILQNNIGPNKALQTTTHLIILLFLADLFATIIKLSWFKDRPQKMTYKNIIGKLMASTFPSIHTSRTFIVFLFSLFTLGYYSIFFGLYFLVVSASRVVIGKHYLSDIIGGIILSTIIFLFYSNRGITYTLPYIQQLKIF